MAPINESKHRVVINDDFITFEIDGKVLNFQSFWLRDQCRCRECYNHSTFQRSLPILDIPDVPIKSITQENKLFKILWKDEHVTTFDVQFLEKYHYENWVNTRRVKRVLWNDLTIDNMVAHVDRNDFLNTERGHFKVFESLVKYGLAFIENVEVSLDATEVVCEKLGGVQYTTLYGGMWTVSTKGIRADTAYTNIELKTHHDNTYYSEGAGLQIFHLLEHSGTGGETTLVDGFLGAEKLKREHPDHFDFLVQHKSEAYFLEDGYDYRNVDSVIKVDDTTGEVKQIRFNMYDRAPMAFKNVEESRKYYAAYKQLAEYYNSGVFKYKLKPGQVIAIDNFRVLHGRCSFTGTRNMGGAYISRSEWLSNAATHGLL